MSQLITGAGAPVTTFASLGLPPGIIASLDGMGITSPLPIQAATIADALAGRDVSAKAPTGSGKTLAFALPVAARVKRSVPKRPKALVLAPTRELATQIAETLRPLLAARDLRVHAFFGGTGYGPQRNALRRGVDVAVACPGRLEDLIQQNDIRLQDVQIVVIDEADRMADMGFLPAVRRILDATEAERQTLLFSATLDGDIDVLVRRYQKDPVRHEVVTEPESLGQMTHRFESVTQGNRVEVCTDVVNASGTSIIFVRTKHGVDRLAKQLSQAGVPAAAIHGGRTQPQREKALAAFRDGKVRVLVATDVAARGIHVDNVTRVVHFDLPADSKDYIHRSGRTARAGADGMVIALVSPDQQGKAKALRRELNLDSGTMSTEPHPGGQRSDSRPPRSDTRSSNRPRRPEIKAAARRRNESQSGGPNFEPQGKRPARGRGPGASHGRPSSGRAGASRGR